MPRQKRILLSIIFGIIITVALTVVAFMGQSRAWTCIPLWQACWFQESLHPRAGGFYEGTPADIPIFFFGVFLGIPIYGGLTYALLSLIEKFKR